MPRRFDLSQHASEDVLAAVAEALEAGQLVVLPTETVYGVAAREDRPAALERLAALKAGRSAPYSLAVDRLETLEPRLRPLTAVARRVAGRWWPGPVTQVLAARDGGELGVRVPGHAFTRDVAARVGPLLLPSANLPGEPAPVAVDALSEAVLAAVAVVVDGGRAALGEASSVVRPGVGGLSVLRAGVVSRDDFAAHVRGRVLVVCSGNTCRSPMACLLLEQALVRQDAGGGVCVPPVVESAGLFTGGGQPATPQAGAVMDRRGLSLDGHASRPAGSLLADADLVLGMTPDHLDAVREQAPGVPAALFDPAGEPVPDPFGAPVGVYEDTARRLEHMARQRAASLCRPSTTPARGAPS